MTAWKINPTGVQTILKNCSEEAESMGKALTPEKFQSLTQAVTGGMTEGGPTVNGVQMKVPQAVNNLFENQKANFENINRRMKAGILGVANATVAYNNGNNEMAANFQSQMMKSADNGDFSYFEKNGYKS